MIAIKYAYMLPADYERLLRTRELPERQGLEQLLGGWDRLHPRFAFLVVEQTVVRMGAHIGYRSIEFRGKDMPFIRAALAGTIRRAARELDTYLADFCRDPRHGDWFNDGRRTMRALCEARGPGGRAGGGTAAAADEGGGDHSAHFSILSEVDQWSRGYIAGAPSEEGANRVSIVLLALHVLTQSRAEQAGFRVCDPLGVLWTRLPPSRGPPPPLPDPTALAAAAALPQQVYPPGLPGPRSLRRPRHSGRTPDGPRLARHGPRRKRLSAPVHVVRGAPHRVVQPCTPC